VKVGEALAGETVIEFLYGPDWYQLRFVVGERNPQHRWRVATFRGDGWGPWRSSGKAWINAWSLSECRLVPVFYADADPLIRGEMPNGYVARTPGNESARLRGGG
jgi:hypothetical protein